MEILYEFGSVNAECGSEEKGGILNFQLPNSKNFRCRISSLIQIGGYRFDRTQFQNLIDYVWCGGYPRWQGEIRPAYVKAMHGKILQNCNGIFEGIALKTMDSYDV